jgi:hypothetical protein
MKFATKAIREGQRPDPTTGAGIGEGVNFFDS